MNTGDMRGAFAFYGSILAFKTLVLTGVTIFKRFQKKDQTHSEIQAIQSTNAPTIIGLWHFRIFALARILHTPAYLYTEGTCSQCLIFLVGYLVNISLAVKCISYFSGIW
ncbi:Microsomal glutathione S-transferase 1 [Schistosoma japonicum]|uniref:Microsomal glutathione S-transferase 1 n=1 Tax=Schistosoma japonicum TaxID=6182 RepID=A0A4Z2DD17_SCHJA|nr:Microsomal glutathione S-transferase 1 [Schistosoma japonicum]